MATIDLALDTLALPASPVDTPVEQHIGTTSIVHSLITFMLPPIPRYHEWLLSWPIIFCSMGDNTPIFFKARADSASANFCSAGVRRYRYITVFMGTFDLPGGPIDTETENAGGAVSIEKTPDTFNLPANPSINTEVS